jgi:hypothetical protein
MRRASREQHADRLAQQGAISRGWADFRHFTGHWWRYRIPAALLTAGFAVWGALLPDSASAGERAALAVAGVVGGALVVGLVVLLVQIATAPIRQRNESRIELKRLTAPLDPAGLAHEFSEWVLAKRAALPQGQMWILPGLFPQPGMSRETHYKLQLDEQKRRGEIEALQAQARVEYHDRFRERIMRLLGEADAELASDPASVGDLVKLAAQVQSATSPTPHATLEDVHAAIRALSDQREKGIALKTELLRVGARSSAQELYRDIDEDGTRRAWIAPVATKAPDRVQPWREETCRVLENYTFGERSRFLNIGDDRGVSEPGRIERHLERLEEIINALRAPGSERMVKSRRRSQES